MLYHIYIYYEILHYITYCIIIILLYHAVGKCSRYLGKRVALTLLMSLLRYAELVTCFYIFWYESVGVERRAILMSTLMRCNRN